MKEIKLRLSSNDVDNYEYITILDRVVHKVHHLNCISRGDNSSKGDIYEYCYLVKVYTVEKQWMLREIYDEEFFDIIFSYEVIE